MALKQTNNGDLYALEQIRARWNTGAGKLKIHLYQNNYTPTETSVPGDFTTPTFEGYAPAYAANWTAPATVSNKAKTAADPIIFTHGVGATSNTIYGYWCEPEDHTGNVQYAEKFTTPITVAVNGDAVVLYPVYTQDTE